LLRSTYLNTAYPYYVVEDGEISKSKPEGLLPRLGGPGKVVIKPYNAVVFERAGEITGIEGPGTVLTKRFEHHKAIVDLRKQWESFTAENVLTKDHVPLTFHCGVGFRVESLPDTIKRREAQVRTYEGSRFPNSIEGDYPVFKSTIYKAVYGTTAAGWTVTTRAAAESMLREVVRCYRLKDLYQAPAGAIARQGSLPRDSSETEDRPRAKASTATKDAAVPGDGISADADRETEKNGAADSDSATQDSTEPHNDATQPSPIDEIAAATRSKLNKISPGWGTTTTSFLIRTVEAPEHVGEKLSGLWAERFETERRRLQAEAASNTIRQRGAAEAHAIASIEKAKLNARNELITSLTRSFLPSGKPQDRQLVERVIAALETLSAALATDTATATRYVEALETMATGAGTKVLIVGEDRHLLPPISTGRLDSVAPGSKGRP
jgi:regulator of protease activity HflC (stomatin/prohibitin superfamily)